MLYTTCLYECLLMRYYLHFSLAQSCRLPSRLLSTQSSLSPQCSSLVLSFGLSTLSSASIIGCEANGTAAYSSHLHASANVTGGGKPPITAPSLPPSVAERASSPKAPLRMRRTPLHFGRKVLVPRRRSCPRNVCVRWHLAAADLLASLERK